KVDKGVGSLECQDAGDRHEAAELDAGGRKIAAAREAMQHRREGALPHFFLEDAYHVGAGIAAVDDERQSGLASSRDMRAQGALLRLARTVVVMIIEPHLADPNHLGIPLALDKIARRNINLLVRVMRLAPNRA